MTGGTTTASAGAKHGRGKPIIYMYTAQVLQTESKRPTLPVAIQSGMPQSSVTTRAHAFNVCWILQQLSAPEIIISFLLLLSGTPIVLPKSTSLRIIHPLFSRELFKIMHTLSPLTYQCHSSCTCHISPRTEAQPLLLSPPDPK